MNKSVHFRNKIRAGKRGWGRNRTADTRIFSPLLCQLSYPAVETSISERIMRTEGVHYAAIPL
jgi:hypothetical protein